MKLPNLLIAGVGRAGTTSTMYALNSHSDIWFITPQVKDRLRSKGHEDRIMHCEMHFFSFRYDKGLEWYSKFFEECGNNPKYLAEKSPSYFTLPGANDAFPRIKGDLTEDVKFILCLREPAERSYSEWAHCKQADYGPSHLAYKNKPSFREAIQDKSKDQTPPHNNWLLSSSDYYSQIESFLNFFNKEQLYILINEEVKLRPHEEYKKLFDWLELDYGTFGEVPVTTGTDRHRQLALGDRGENQPRRPIVPDFVNHANYERFGVLQDEDREYLNKYFKESKDKLYKYMGRDIKIWEI